MGSDSEFGLGDTVQSFFFSPKAPTAGGWIWGVGPVLLLPTSTDDRFGLGEWGVGVTGLALRQSGGWTYGALANHIIDVDGDIGINSTFVQPSYVSNIRTRRPSCKVMSISESFAGAAYKLTSGARRTA